MQKIKTLDICFWVPIRDGQMDNVSLLALIFFKWYYTWGHHVCLPVCTFYEAFSHRHLWIAPFSIGSLARAILGKLPTTITSSSQQSQHNPLISSLSHNWYGLTYRLKTIAIIPRSSASPSLCLDHRVCSNGVKLQTNFITHTHYAKHCNLARTVKW